MKIKALYAAYIAARDVANVAEMAYEKEPENEAIENAFDEAYKTEIAALMALVNEIVALSHGAINQKTARRMVLTAEDKFSGIIEKIA